MPTALGFCWKIPQKKRRIGYYLVGTTKTLLRFTVYIMSTSCKQFSENIVNKEFWFLASLTFFPSTFKFSWRRNFLNRKMSRNKGHGVFLYFLFVRFAGVLAKRQEISWNNVSHFLRWFHSFYKWTRLTTGRFRRHLKPAASCPLTKIIAHFYYVT